MFRKPPPVEVAWLVPCLIAASLLLAGLGPGCHRGTRPRLGLVRGRVTLDGKPLAGAAIAFLPDDTGRESTAFTDDGGNYTLTYIRDVQGAAVGWHTIRISTGDPRADKPELVPTRYHVKSQLRRKVVRGDNEINFDLLST